MAIEKYTTEGLILEAYDQGEHDRAFKVFTKDYGMIICHARSVRKLESKLRSHLLPRTFSTLTLVKGREVWRLTGAEKKNQITPYIGEVSELVKRFVRGESVHKALYRRMSDLSSLTEEYDKDKVRLLIYYVLLVELGYADGSVIGAKNIKEYAKYSIEDLYTHLLLHYKSVRDHTLLVLKEVQL